MKKLIFVLLLVFVIGCAEKPFVKVDSCTTLANNFDKVMLGDETIFNSESVGGTLINISSKYYNYEGSATYKPEYIYSLTFKGVGETFKAKFYYSNKVEVPMQIGTFYKFQMNKAVGAVTSMGPHHGMFPYKELKKIFTEVKC